MHRLAVGGHTYLSMTSCCDPFHSPHPHQEDGVCLIACVHASMLLYTKTLHIGGKPMLGLLPVLSENPPSSILYCAEPWHQWDVPWEGARSRGMEEVRSGRWGRVVVPALSLPRLLGSSPFPVHAIMDSEEPLKCACYCTNQGAFQLDTLHGILSSPNRN